MQGISMQLVIAAGLALAWGLVGGAVDAVAFSTMEFATPAVALRYAAASALLVSCFSLAGGLGVFALCQLGPGRTAPKRLRLALVALQVTAILIPALLRILPLAQRRLLPLTPVLSPAGLALTAGVVLGLLTVGAGLAWLVLRVWRGGFRWLAGAGWAGTLAALVGVLSGAWGAGADAPRSERPNLLLISIDSLRQDVFYEYAERFASPTLRDFVAGGRRFRDAYTTFTHSLPSHASMFTGLYPPEHGAVLFAQPDGPPVGSPLAAGVRTLAESLGEAGYETVAILSNAWVGPPFGLEKGFETYFNYGIARQVGYFDPALATFASVVGPYLRYAQARWLGTLHPNSRLFLQWLRSRDPSRPFFAFLHYIEMHTPNAPPAQHRERFCRGPYAGLDGTQMLQRIEARAFSEREMPAVREHLRNLHFAALAQMDEFVSPALEELARGGWLEDTLVALVSDHGEDLYGKADTYGKSHVYQGSTRIPFVLRVPGDGGGVWREGLVSLVDLPTTFSVRAGVPAPAGGHGLDLVSSAGRDGGANEWIYVQGWDHAHEDFARAILFADGIKWIRAGDGREEVYDWRRDPEELHDLAGSVLAQVRARTGEVLASLGQASSRPLGARELPPEVVERLKAMGYLR
jgi:arylsulfatase A-like enzyme